MTRETIKKILKKMPLFGIASRGLRLLGRNGASPYDKETIENEEMVKSREMIKEYISTNEVKKLHIGSGHNILEGWLNSDLDPAKYSHTSGDAIYLDATKTFPFDDCVFDYVYSEHMIEHITFAEGLDMLSECYRVLKPGGKIRLSTPDLAFLIELYQPNKSTLQREYIKYMIQRFAKERAKDARVRDAISYEDTFVINMFFRKWRHKFIYDEKVLRRLLEEVGFVSLARCALNESEDEELVGLAYESRYPDGFLDLETITIEGTKPIS